MAEIFNLDFRRGTLLDSISGAKSTLPSGANLTQGEKGLSLQHSGGANSVNTGVVVSSTVHSIVLFVKADRTSSTSFRYILSSLDGSGDGFSVAYYNKQIRYEINGSSATSGVHTPYNNWACVIITYSGTAAIMYVNGVWAGGTSTTHTVSVTATMKLFNLGYATTKPFGGNIAKATIYNHVLSTDEVSAIYKDFLQSQPLIPTKRNFTYPKPMDLSNETGLVAAYNMKPVHGKLIDISGNGIDLTPTMFSTVKGGIRTIKDKTLMEVGVTLDIGTVNTICVRYNNLDGVAHYICGDNASNNIQVRATDDIQYKLNDVRVTSTKTYETNTDHTIHLTRSGGSIKIYLNGVHLETITHTETTEAGLIDDIMSRGASTMENFNLNNFEIYNYEMTAEEVYASAMRFKEINLLENFEGNGADGIVKVPIGWEKGIGDYKIGELTADDAVLTHLTKGTKYLECSVSGTIATASEQAYGTWEFDMNKVLDASLSNFNFFNDGDNGYKLAFGGTERVILYSHALLVDTAIAYSAEDYIVIGVWYRVKVTRDLTGKFTIYIKGGSFGDSYIQVDVTGGGGTNPIIDTTYTTCKQMSHACDVGDKLTNIVNTNIIE